MFIAHGVSEHCERHHKLALLLQENQFAVYAHDHGMDAILILIIWCSFILEICEFCVYCLVLLQLGMAKVMATEFTLVTFIFTSEM